MGGVSALSATSDWFAVKAMWNGQCVALSRLKGALPAPKVLTKGVQRAGHHLCSWFKLCTFVSRHMGS